MCLSSVASEGNKYYGFAIAFTVVAGGIGAGNVRVQSAGEARDRVERR